jgi:hypothetical protein
MIYSRDSTVYYFDPEDASLLYGTVQSRMCVRQGDPLGMLLFNLAISTPLRSIGERCKNSSATQALCYDGTHLQNAFRPDCDYGGYGGIGESLLEGSTDQVFVHGTPTYNP